MLITLKVIVRAVNTQQMTLTSRKLCQTLIIMRRYLSCCLQVGSLKWKNVIKWIIIIGEKSTSEYLQGLNDR
jgi:hypothetical protein